MQTSVALSTTESELNGFVILGKEIVWLRNFLAEVGLTPKEPATVFLKQESQDQEDTQQQQQQY